MVATMAVIVVVSVALMLVAAAVVALELVTAAIVVAVMVLTFGIFMMAVLPWLPQQQQWCKQWC